MAEGNDSLVNGVNYSNISSIGRKQSELQEMRIIEIFELVNCLLAPIVQLKKDGLTNSEIFTYISEILVMPSVDVHGNALGVNEERLRHFADSLSAMDKAIFADFLSDGLSGAGVSLSEGDFLPENDFPESFIYLKNPLADEAYDVFSLDFKDPRLTYATSLKQVAKSVFDGDVTYGLLPFEEGGGERLHLASELIYRYDLKINLVTPVFGLDGAADMKYSLVSRRFRVPFTEPGDDCYLEIRVDGSTSLSELIFALDYFGATLYRIKSEIFTSDDEGESCYCLVIKKEGGHFEKILGYLTMFIKSCVFVGIYKNLE